MNRPRLFKGLRIAFSATCGIVAVLLVVLWVRSYWWQERCSVQLPSSQRLSAMSMRGQISFRKHISNVDGFFRISRRIQIDSVFDNLARESGQSVESLKRKPPDYHLSFLVVPHWFPALAAATLAAVPWIRWRYSLSTLLMAMTLVALVLGVTIVLSR
jgi:hypothetical protein